jgi:hypothetical protein
VRVVERLEVILAFGLFVDLLQVSYHLNTETNSIKQNKY